MVTNEFNIVDLVNLGVALAILTAATLSVIYVIYGGISFILSGGQEDKIKQAIGTIRGAFIGLVITILAVTLVRIVGAVFNFDFLSVISWPRISELMRGVMDRILNSGGSVPGGGSLR